jgi:drug/metabolite transporter (DMT)-like permease
MKRNLAYLLMLALLGAGWGLTQPLSKIAVSTGYQYFGLIVWQLVTAVVILGIVSLIRRRGLPLAVGYLWRYLLLALVGTVLPNSVSYQAAAQLPSGFLSVLISLVPMFALPMALAMRMEQFSLARSFGVICGAVAIALLAGPKTNLPDPALIPWIFIAAISPFLYAVEGTWVARYGILDLDAVQVMLGASIVGLAIVVPLAIASDQWVDLSVAWAAPEYALLGSSSIHVFVYTAYVWLVGRTGSVFASQVSYLVTGFGVFWAILLLGENYSGWVWGAMAVMMLGLFLVAPRSKAPLAERP